MAAETEIGRKPAFIRLAAGSGVLLAAFLAFYGRAYFSPGAQGMLGYELKDTLAQLAGYARALGEGGTLLWDPDYFQYVPRLPQAPLQSPLTWAMLGGKVLGVYSGLDGMLAMLLALLALVQTAAAGTMYFFLRSRKLSPGGSLVGGLAYAFNHQTFVFGIRHGYERIGAIALLPLAAWAVYRLFESEGGRRFRGLTGLSGLLLGLCFTLNGDVKPTAFFCFFFLLLALCRPRRVQNLAALGAVFLLAAGVFLAQALPTYYGYREMNRGAETPESRLDFSLAPRDLLLTQISTEFSPRPDYPWENTAEFSMTLMVSVLLGLISWRSLPERREILAGIVFALVWMMGKHTPLAGPLGWLMGVTGLRHPARAAFLLYFFYAFLAAHGLTRLRDQHPSRAALGLIFLLPLGILVLRLLGPKAFSWRLAVCPALGAASVWAGSRFGFSRFVPGVFILLFLLEQTTLFASLEEGNRGDPTGYRTFARIYSPQPREADLLERPDAGDYRTFFASRDFPGFFSHNYYLPGVAAPGRVRPIWPYFYLDEEFVRVAEVKGVMLEDWAHPFWDLLRVKYIVDLERYFSDWDEEDVSRKGLEHLRRLGPHLWLNPGCEEADVFVRFRARILEPEEFFRRARSGALELADVAYLEPGAEDFELPGPEGEAAVKILDRAPGRIRAELSLDRPGIAIFSEYWFFPWKARVDGQAASAFPINHILIGALVPEGKHTVEFYFDFRHPAFLVPILFSWGLAIFLSVYSFLNLRQGKRV